MPKRKILKGIAQQAQVEQRAQLEQLESQQAHSQPEANFRPKDHLPDRSPGVAQ